jgi:hypothetical protein
LKYFPTPPTFLTADVQHLAPVAFDITINPPQAAQIAGYAIIGIVAPQDLVNLKFYWQNSIKTFSINEIE